MFSTVASGFSLQNLSITFSADFRAKPNTSKADNASSLFVLFEKVETSSKLYILSTLSFKSKITR